MTKPDKYGFPKTNSKSVKRIHGFQTGDKVKLIQPSGKYKGAHQGELSVRKTGMFDLKKDKVKITSKYTNFKLLSRFDGYAYNLVMT